MREWKPVSTSGRVHQVTSYLIVLERWRNRTLSESRRGLTHTEVVKRPWSLLSDLEIELSPFFVPRSYGGNPSSGRPNISDEFRGL